MPPKHSAPPSKATAFSSKRIKTDADIPTIEAGKDVISLAEECESAHKPLILSSGKARDIISYAKYLETQLDEAQQQLDEAQQQLHEGSPNCAPAKEKYPEDLSTAVYKLRGILAVGISNQMEVSSYNVQLSSCSEGDWKKVKRTGNY
jgi:hypothetical protein